MINKNNIAKLLREKNTRTHLTFLPKISDRSVSFQYRPYHAEENSADGAARHPYEGQSAS